MACYELGHRGSLSIPEYDPETRALKKSHTPDKEVKFLQEVHLPLDMAIKYHLVMNMFYHPYYIVEYPVCREAIDEILNYITLRKANVKHMGNDQLTEWWNARSLSTVTEMDSDDQGYNLVASCDYPAGMIVKVLLKNRCPEQVVSDDRPLAYQVKKEFGVEWLYIVVPSGKHNIEVKWS